MTRTGLAAVKTAVLVVLVAALACAGEPPKKVTETVKDKEGEAHSFDMVLVPGGKFKMGSPDGEEGRKKHEGPQFVVEIKPFYLAATETTFDLFMAYYEETVQEKRGTDAAKEAEKKAEEAKKKGVDAITGPTPLYGDPTLGWGAGKRPAIGVTWINAVTFCKWLSKKTGKNYRLPTEAEWEYACRAGTKTPYSFGDDPDKLEDYAWFEDNSDEKTQEVARKKPNPWGLYDMHGNVREWVLDFYSPRTYAENARNGPAVSPEGPARGKVHVARGGAYDSLPEELRCADRAFKESWWDSGFPQEPKSKWWLPKMTFIGFRVVREIESE